MRRTAATWRDATAQCVTPSRHSTAGCINATGGIAANRCIAAAQYCRCQLGALPLLLGEPSAPLRVAITAARPAATRRSSACSSLMVCSSPARDSSTARGSLAFRGSLAPSSSAHCRISTRGSSPQLGSSQPSLGASLPSLGAAVWRITATSHIASALCLAAARTSPPLDSLLLQEASLPPRGHCRSARRCPRCLAIRRRRCVHGWPKFGRRPSTSGFFSSRSVSPPRLSRGGRPDSEPLASLWLPGMSSAVPHHASHICFGIHYRYCGLVE